MQTVINAAIISHGQLLVLEKKDVWILPGGKVQEREKDSECLGLTAE